MYIGYNPLCTIKKIALKPGRIGTPMSLVFVGTVCLFVCVLITPEAGATTLKDIFFEKRDLLTESAKTDIEKNLIVFQDLILANPNTETVLILEGYSDTEGTEEQKLITSQKRADRVRNYLVELGLKPENITAVGKGGTDKFAEGNTPQALKLNRRVHFVVEQSAKPTPIPTGTPEPALEDTPGTETELSPAEAIGNIELEEYVQAKVKMIASDFIEFNPTMDMSVWGSYLVEVSIPSGFLPKFGEGVITDDDTTGVVISRVGQYVGLKLEGKAFDIRPVTKTGADNGGDTGDRNVSISKLLTEGTETKWHWYVVPQRSGLQSLTLKMSVDVEDGEYTEYRVESSLLERIVNVKAELATTIVKYIRAYWAVIVIVFICIGVIVALLKRK